VGVLVGVFVGVRVGVLVGVLVGVRVGVLVGVLVGVGVGVFVGVPVGVAVGVSVGVWVGVKVGVGVGVVVGVSVRVLVGSAVGGLVGVPGMPPGTDSVSGGSSNAVNCAATHARWAGLGKAICHHALSGVRPRIWTMSPLLRLPIAGKFVPGPERTRRGSVTIAWTAPRMGVGVAAKRRGAEEKKRVSVLTSMAKDRIFGKTQ
jgi:hypothetical protein